MTTLAAAYRDGTMGLRPDKELAGQWQRRAAQLQSTHT
jgi:hypothetical protein